jgi:hypothetical protein
MTKRYFVIRRAGKYLTEAGGWTIHLRQARVFAKLEDAYGAKGRLSMSAALASEVVPHWVKTEVPW